MLFDIHGDIWIDPPYDNRPLERLNESIVAMNSEIWQSQDILKVIYNKEDFNEAVKEDRLAIVLGIEGLDAIGENIEYIYTLYQLGFRHASLTWNEENALATGINSDKDRGITSAGKDAN